MRDSIGFVFCRHYTKAAESRFHIFTLTLSPRFMYKYCFSSAGRGNGRGAMPFLMSFVLEPEIVTSAWIDNASVQFPLNIYATRGQRKRGGRISGGLLCGGTPGPRADVRLKD